MKKLLLITATILLSSSSMAAAGGGTMKHSDGSKVRIKCTGAGCVTKLTHADGTKAEPIKSEGGAKNYRALVKQWHAKGYK